MKRICLVVPNLKAGGQERVMSQLASYFAENKNYDIHLLLFNRAEKAYELSNKVEVHEPDFYFNPNSRLIYTIKTLFFLRTRVRSIKPDIILSFGEVWNSFVLLSVSFIKIDKFISDRCNPMLQLSLLQRILRRILYPRAKGIISQTQIAKELLFSRVKHPNITVIGNPIRPIICKDVKRENIILNVGRFIPEKRQKLLIRLFSEMGRWDWRLVFVGDGSLLQEAKEYAKSLGIDGNVFFEGSIRNVEDYYLRSKIFAYASVSEGFPNVLGEALSSGLAVVSSHFIAGSEDLIEDEYNGYLIPENEDEVFKAKLLYLMDTPMQRAFFSLNSEKILKRFKPEIVCEKYFDFITSC